MKLDTTEMFLQEPVRDKVFWYVFVPVNGQPTEKHYSFKHAKEQAFKIARKTGKETFILQAIKSYKPNDIVETNFMHEDKKAFRKENKCILSLEAQQRTEALRKYPQLEGKVKITNEKIIVTTDAGDLSFRFSHTEGGQNFEKANKPYTKEQFEALVQVFGKSPAPYLEILGMKNTHIDNGKTYNWNSYWSSSRYDNHNAWGLLFNELEVLVGYYFQGNRDSAVSSPN